MLNLKRWIIEITVVSLLFAGVGYAAHEQYFPNGVKTTSINNSDGNITNVGDIALDSISADGSTITVNESGADVDFRVESDTNANALYVDGGTGYVGIGTTSPDYPLGFAAAMGQKIGLYDGSTIGFGVQSNLLQIIGDSSEVDFAFGYGTSGSLTRVMTIEGTGNVGIGVTDPDEALEVVGDIKSSTLAGTGNRAVYSDSVGVLTNSSSDRSMKTNIEAIPYGLSETLDMTPIRFNWVDTNRLGSQKEIGFTAQDIEEIVPEVIGMNADGTKSLDYPKLTAVLCKAIQELNAQIESLESRIKTLEGGD